MSFSVCLLTSDLDSVISDVIAELILSPAGIDSTKKLPTFSLKIGSVVDQMIVLKLSVDGPRILDTLSWL